MDNLFAVVSLFIIYEKINYYSSLIIYIHIHYGTLASSILRQ